MTTSGTLGLAAFQALDTPVMGDWAAHDEGGARANRRDAALRSRVAPLIIMVVDYLPLWAHTPL